MAEAITVLIYGINYPAQFSYTRININNQEIMHLYCAISFYKRYAVRRATIREVLRRQPASSSVGC